MNEFLNNWFQLPICVVRIVVAKVFFSTRFGLCIYAEKSVVFAEMTGLLPRNPTLFAANLTKSAV